MQVYFVKATFTNNVYKLSDFFLNGDYKLTAGKMLDLNFIANDDQTFVRGTRKLTLPDTTSIREHTHIIVPDYNKIYRITNIQYVNAQQADIFLTEDALIGNYLDLEDKDIILSRSNDIDLFRGQNDISDLTLKETVDLTVINSEWKTGKWALLFYQFDPAATSTSSVGMHFVTTGILQDYQAASLAILRTLYPEVSTDFPEQYEYFQKIAAASTYYQCVYDGTKLLWVDYDITILNKDVFVGIQSYGSKINSSDVITFCVALPFEQDLWDAAGNQLVAYDNFVGPDGVDLIDIKIIDDSLLLKDGAITYNLVGTLMKKTIAFQVPSGISRPAYTDAGLTTLDGRYIIVLTSLDNEFTLNPSYVSGVLPAVPTKAEPFYKYELYMYGQRFSIPYYLTDKINIIIAVNSGVINYIIYYNNKRNIIGSGSFTHSVRYSIDQLEKFYSENPTYKEQFYLRLAGNASKAVIGGAISGSVLPGVGTLAGAAGGAAGAAVDAGLALANLHYMEKGLALKPDQIYGETSELALQLVNIFGIYWVKKTPENQDLMLNEYYLRGFPTSYVRAIEDLDYAVSGMFGTSKVIFGQMKQVVRNEYTTNYINKKLKEGIILIP